MLALGWAEVNLRWSKVGNRLVRGWSQVGPRLITGWSKVGHRSVTDWSKVGQRLVTGWPEVDRRLATGQSIIATDYRETLTMPVQQSTLRMRTSSWIISSV